jgi:hypothetical protein
MSQLLDDLQSVLDADLKDLDPKSMPLLAHYTTMATLEEILRHDEIWFSHPTFMNDHAEVHDSLRVGCQAVIDSKLLMGRLGANCVAFLAGFHQARVEYERGHVFDTYIFSLSAHDAADYDGRLSMWRGYGAQGHGAALVINPTSLMVENTSPFVFDKVEYIGLTGRNEWLADFIMRIAQCVERYSGAPAEWAQAGRNTFGRLCMAANFSKHIGFSEEEEWRIVYMPQRDPKGLLKGSLSYINGDRGLEPKLKFKLRPIPGVAGAAQLVDVTDRIILGPSRASPFLVNTTHRMLQAVGKPQLQGKVHASSIPFRSSV